MSAPADHADLIARLEAATGPDRKLDALIWQVTDPEAFAVTKSHRLAFTNRDWTEEEKARESESKARTYAPLYTASIDAALTLVPEGYYGRVWFGERPEHIAYHESTAAVWATDTKVRHSIFGCSSKQTLAAVAICIAALHARPALPARSSMGGAEKDQVHERASPEVKPIGQER